MSAAEATDALPRRAAATAMIFLMTLLPKIRGAIHHESGSQVVTETAQSTKTDSSSPPLECAPWRRGGREVGTKKPRAMPGLSFSQMPKSVFRHDRRATEVEEVVEAH